MTQDRYNDLKTALYEHIEEKKPCDDLTLLICLVSRLDEWVEHLETAAFASGGIEQTDFFAMFMVGMEVIDEVKSISEFKPVFPERDWTEFKNTVTWLEKTRDGEDVSLIERTYQKFKNSFTEFSEENSNHDGKLGTRHESLNQEEPPETEPVSGPSPVKWWPRPNLLSPIELRTSRVVLSLAILLLLACIVCFVKSPIISGALPGAASLYKESSVCFFYLSVLFFTVWMVLRLWFKVRPRSQK